jgi:hypothetical protein
MTRKPDPAAYVTVIDPRLKPAGGPLQVLTSPKPERKAS